MQMSELSHGRDGGGRSGDVGRCEPEEAAALSCRSAKGFDSSVGGTRMLGAAIGFGTGSNVTCLAPGLPVRRRESPDAAEVEVALREDPCRSTKGGGIEGVQECSTDTLELEEATEGAADAGAELAGVDAIEPVREDEAEDPPVLMKSVALRMSMQ